MPPPTKVHPSGDLKTQGRPPRPQDIIPSSGKELILPDPVPTPPPSPVQSSTSWKAPGSSPRSQSNHTHSQKEVLGLDSVDTAVQSFLSREHYLWKELDKHLQHQELLNVRRQELVHKQWVESVSRPLLSAVSQKIESQSSREIERRRQVQLAEYLKNQKEKGTLFLETYDPEEYDPLQHKNLGQLEVKIPRLRDPLNKAAEDRLEEDRTILQCRTGNLYTVQEYKEIVEARRRLRRLRWRWW
ncbi:protein FAM228B [Tachyglossus aculeatus]|uniref:protein FAM228B n=1 Tax=Tachyglossus aculeatus TaxID=9261 RepID=UPI0018F722B0|nr:protein FAM228B [Tachyglossus aculeatus]XP_038607681.1 protein FAM228B [Tachyglossus aculeatus]